MALIISIDNDIEPTIDILNNFISIFNKNGPNLKFYHPLFKNDSFAYYSISLEITTQYYEVNPNMNVLFFSEESIHRSLCEIDRHIHSNCEAVVFIVSQKYYDSFSILSNHLNLILNHKYIKDASIKVLSMFHGNTHNLDTLYQSTVYKQILIWTVDNDLEFLIPFTDKYNQLNSYLLANRDDLLLENSIARLAEIFISHYWNDACIKKNEELTGNTDIIMPFDMDHLENVFDDILKYKYTSIENNTSNEKSKQHAANLITKLLECNSFTNQMDT